MRAVAAITLAAAIASAWTPSVLAADDPPVLTHNPFSRPSSEQVRVERSVTEDDEGTEGAIPLQATMIGRVNRLANVGGRVIKPGDEYQGYRLLQVQEQFAVFERDGRSVTVYVKPLLAEDEDGKNENRRYR